MQYLIILDEEKKSAAGSFNLPTACSNALSLDIKVLLMPLSIFEVAKKHNRLYLAKEQNKSGIPRNLLIMPIK